MVTSFVPAAEREACIAGNKTPITVAGFSKELTSCCRIKNPQVQESRNYKACIACTMRSHINASTFHSVNQSKKSCTRYV